MDEKEFEALYKKCREEVRKCIRGRVRSADEEDVVQEAFILAWMKRSELETKDRPVGWIINTAKFKCKERLRDRFCDFTSLEDAEWCLGQEEREHLLLEWVLFLERYLSPKDRRIFLAVCLEGRSLKEVGKMEGISAENVRWRLLKIKKRLKDALLKY